MIKIIDETTNEARVVRSQIMPLPPEFGLSLDTVAKAREWLTNPNNWFESTVFILKWDGLLPKVSARHGQRLVDEPWDDGLAQVVVREQVRLRRGGKQEEPESRDE